MNKSQILKSAKGVLHIESKAINDLAKSLDDNFLKAVESIKNLKGKLIISGIGKSGNIAANCCIHPGNWLKTKNTPLKNCKIITILRKSRKRRLI